jgi:hypothetical protein
MSVTADTFRQACGADDLVNAESDCPCRRVFERLVRDRCPRLEDFARLRIDRLRVPPVTLEQLEHVTGIYAAELIQTHSNPS